MKDTVKTMNAIAWFEIPATNFDRAVKFYEKVLGGSIEREKMGDNDMGVFPHLGDTSVAGCIWHGKGYRPSPDGTAVYLHAEPDLAAALARVESAGGRVVVPKTALPPGMGHYAQFIDSEGNRVGLYSMN